MPKSSLFSVDKFVYISKSLFLNLYTNQLNSVMYNIHSTNGEYLNIMNNYS